MSFASIFSTLLIVFTFFVAIYMIGIIVFYFILFIISAFQLRKEYKLDQYEPYEELAQSSLTRPVSILVPAYNEEAGIVPSVRSLLSINYPEFEVIVINDGSKDNTLKETITHFEMVKVEKAIRKQVSSNEIVQVYQSTIYENLFMIDKLNGGKADALNAGLNVAQYPYFCSLDGDSIIERDAFIKVMKPIIDSKEDIVAVGGSVRIANGCTIERGEVMNVQLARSPLVIMQVIEYFRAFLMGRIGLSRHNLLLIISGAFGVFHRESVVKVNGYRTNTVGEDMDLVVRLHKLIKEEKSGKRIVYVPDPVCWTEAPESPKILRRQRSRWHRGLFESLWHNKKMMCNPKYGLVGMISMPYFFIVEFLGPVIELLGYIIMILSPFIGGVYTSFALLLFMLAIIYGSLLSMSAVLLEEWSLRRYPKVKDLVRLYVYSLSEAFWFRPLTVLWRVEGIVQLIKGNNSWGEMSRKGVSK
ncbi:cellulose synthase/poly-beta-1,6-N-acetylglucosamine synthase-like glycosyltransferase [Alkalihalobacillus hemicentroti]|uniref:Cellulose synthase/poly-beta-1,6-N-acetylglucosamine synthase-like glycosyltransferase n=1 Tax=Guptibacillus hwajinpoensis TaxID=208199 RepID=A0ABU0K482_9BACL|nr:cellulose synthase/poly-beta-1,6-N-acetylglucosamine synthase-like glycosyltransferase [Alkalihalobacillus hemicentroti]